MMKDIEVVIEVPVIHVNNKIAQYLKDQDYITKSEILSRIRKESQNEVLPRQSLIPSKISFKELEEKMPGRTLQIKQIASFLESLKHGDRSPLCLHGNTGCGKTSLVLEIIKNLEDNNSQFENVYINCMSIWSVKHIYSYMLEKFFSRRCKKPEKVLNQMLCWPKTEEKENVKLLILDEVDQYFNEHVFMYNILEWLQRSKVKFGIVMISNMIDFSVNLEAKMRSRLKFNSIVFAPYNYSKLIQILNIKYPEIQEIFERDAIVYLCKKVASLNSDVRLLEKYYESLLKEWKTSQISKVTIEEVRQKLSTPPQMNQFLTPYKFLISILLKTPAKGCIANQVYNYSFMNFQKKFTIGEVLEYLKQLEQFGFLTVKRFYTNGTLFFHEWGITLSDQIYLIDDN